MGDWTVAEHEANVVELLLEALNAPARAHGARPDGISIDRMRKKILHSGIMSPVERRGNLVPAVCRGLRTPPRRGALGRVRVSSTPWPRVQRTTRRRRTGCRPMASGMPAITSARSSGRTSSRRSAEHPYPMGIVELAQKVQISPGSVHRLLATLISIGWVEQNSRTAKYRLGTRMLGVGTTALITNPVIQRGKAYLARLAESAPGTTRS